MSLQVIEFNVAGKYVIQYRVKKREIIPDGVYPKKLKLKLQHYFDLNTIFVNAFFTSLFLRL